MKKHLLVVLFLLSLILVSPTGRGAEDGEFTFAKAGREYEGVLNKTNQIDTYKLNNPGNSTSEISIKVWEDCAARVIIYSNSSQSPDRYFLYGESKNISYQTDSEHFFLKLKYNQTEHVDFSKYSLSYRLHFEKPQDGDIPLLGFIGIGIAIGLVVIWVIVLKK
ncbi:MAG: hypothetical protein KGY76_05515 [Candidatus Thermoplasmatota archaeon]|nr:hypothetical protein [Candidatus Thermoplasmatota archaeon]